MLTVHEIPPGKQSIDSNQVAPVLAGGNEGAVVRPMAYAFRADLRYGAFMNAAQQTANLEALCLEHMAAEERALDQELQAARQLQAALQQGGYPALLAAVQAQHDAVLIVDDMRQRRQYFQEQAACLLDLAPSEVTLRLLSQWFSPTVAAQMEESRRRLEGLVQEVQHLNEQNRAQVRHGLSFLEHFFQELLGHVANPSRYGPAGKVQSPPTASASLIEVRG